jgi:hypothetical protein
MSTRIIYGRSRWIGVEPFTLPPVQIGRLTAEILRTNLDEITLALEKYWPRYWGNLQGALPDKAFELQAEDFLVMEKLGSRRSGNVPQSLSSRYGSPSKKWADWQHFLVEDTNQASAQDLDDTPQPRRLDGTDDLRVPANFGVSLEYWRKQAVSDWQLEQTMARFDKSFAWILKSLKSRFQRPRPHQAMTDFSRPFYVYDTESGQHPSFPAGHTLQSALWTATLLFESDLAPSWTSHQKDLVSWAAGVSDRRVYAGLHYPSDTIAGWIASFVIGKTLWPQSDIEAHFADIMAISEPVQVIRQTPAQFPRLTAMLREID